jgi:hypothetical protein
MCSFPGIVGKNNVPARTPPVEGVYAEGGQQITLLAEGGCKNAILPKNGYSVCFEGWLKAAPRIGLMCHPSGCRSSRRDQREKEIP